MIENINRKKLEKSLKLILNDETLRLSYQKKAWKNFNLSSAYSSKKLDTFRKIILNNYY